MSLDNFNSNQTAKVGKFVNNTKTDNKKSLDQRLEAAEQLATTFADVRNSKNAQVQSALDQHLEAAVGKYFTLAAAEFQETPDFNNPDKLNTATVYSVRITSNKAWLPLGLEIQIKIKDQKPIFSQDELQEVMFGSSAPVVVAFDQLAHYHFGSGESLNAANIHKVNISAKEAMNID